MTPIKVELQLDTGKFQTDLKNAVNALSGIEVSANRAAGSMNKVESGSEKAAAGLRRAATAGNAFTSVFRDISVITGAFSQAMSIVSSISSGWVGDIVRVNAEMERLNFQMRAMSTASDPIKDAAENVAWLRREAAQAPFSLKAITDSFVKMKAARLEPKEGMLKSFIDGLATFGGSDEQLNRVSVAITQMAGKSVIQMEELRQQLGEHMPTAMQLMARSMGMTVAELSKTVATGTLDARTSLQKLSDEMERAYGGASLRMMESFTGQLSQLKTNLQLLATDTGGEAFFAVIKKELLELNEFLKSNEAKVYAKQLGEVLAEIALAIKDTLGFIWEYRDALMAIAQAIAGVYAINKLSAMFTAFGATSAGALKAMKGALGEVAWGVSAIGDGLTGLRTKQSVFTSLRLGALGFGVALKGLTASIPLIGIALLAIQGIVELFLNWESAAEKAKRATDEAYEAAKNGSTKNYEETKKAIDDKIKQLEEEKKVAQSIMDGTYWPEWVNKLNRLTDFSDNQRREYYKAKSDYQQADSQIMSIGVEREKIEGARQREDKEIGSRSVENIIYTRGDDAQREYNERMRELDRMRDLEITNAAKTGASIKEVQDKYNGLNIETQKKLQNQRLAIIREELKKQEDLLDRYARNQPIGKDAPGEYQTLGAVEFLRKQEEDIQKAQAELDPSKLIANTMAAAVDSDTTKIKNGAKALMKLKESVSDLKAEVLGAGNAFTSMLAQINQGKYGALDETNEGVQKLHRELLEMAAEKTVFDKMREGFNSLRNDIDRVRKKNLDQRIQNAIRREEANNGGFKLTEEQKIRIAMREGKYFGNGSSSVIQKQFEELEAEVNRQAKLATQLGGAFRNDAFGNSTVTQIDLVKNSLNGVAENLSNIGNLTAGVNISNAFQTPGVPSSLNNFGLGQVGQINSVTIGMSELNSTIKGSANLMSKNMARWGNPAAPGWRQNNITQITANSGKSAWVHKDAAASFLGFINELEASGYKINSLGGYNLRTKLGGTSLSEHAFGNAIDINPGKNPMGGQLITDMPNNISELAAKWGLSWGGDWKKTKDAMHFEWTGRRSFGPNPASSMGQNAQATAQSTAPKVIVAPELKLDGFEQQVIKAAPAIEKFTQDALTDSELDSAATRKDTFLTDIKELSAQAQKELTKIYETPAGAGDKYAAAYQSMLNNQEDPRIASNQRILEQMRQLDQQSALATKDQQLKKEMKEDELRLAAQIAEYNKKAADPNYQGKSEELRNILLMYDEMLQKAAQLEGGTNNPVYKSLEQSKAAALRSQSNLEVAQRRASSAQEAQDLRDSLMTQSQLRDAQMQRDLARLNQWAADMRASGATEVEITESVEQQKAIIKERYAQQANPVAKQMKEWADINSQIEKSATGWMDSIAGGIAGLITGTGDLRSVINGIVNDIAKIAVKGMLSSMFGGGAGKGAKGAAGGAAKSLFTKGGAVHHTGGIAGNRGSFRSMSALAWAGAPKFHTGGIIGGGLLPSEVPIIAKKGEGVFTPDQMEAMGGFQQNQVVQINSPITVNGSSGTPEQNEDLAKQMSRQMEGTMRAIVADEMRKQSRPGSFMNTRSR